MKKGFEQFFFNLGNRSEFFGIEIGSLLELQNYFHNASPICIIQ